jgi:hypothetical protein
MVNPTGKVISHQHLPKLAVSRKPPAVAKDKIRFFVPLRLRNGTFDQRSISLKKMALCRFNKPKGDYCLATLMVAGEVFFLFRMSDGVSESARPHC